MRAVSRKQSWKGWTTVSDDYARGYEEAGWLAEHNRIYNLVYMAINDYNSNDALIFGQIMYWHGKTSRGKRRLRVEREGYFWLAKSYKDWEKEMLLKERTVRDCLERIEKRGLIEKRTWMFNGLTTVHVRVKYEVLQEALDRVAHLFLDEDESELDRREASIGIDGKRQSGCLC